MAGVVAHPPYLQFQRIASMILEALLSPRAPEAGPNVQLIFGPMLVGAFLNTILYGILIVQSFIYYRTYKNDKAWIRYLILYLFFIETLNTGFDIAIIYEPLVLRFGTPEAVGKIPVMLIPDPMILAMISSPIQCFIAWRILIISKSKATVAVILFFSFASLIGSYATIIGVSVTDSQTYPTLRHMAPSIITWLVSSATADLIITASLVYHLYRRKTGVRSTDDIINRIMRITIQTGMITALFAVLDVVTFVVLKDTAMNFAWDFPLSKLYSNSLLSTLNARAGWDNLAGDDQQNVLFAADHSQSMLRSKPVSNKNSRTPANHQKIITGVYELGTPSITVPAKDSDTDLEQGGVHVRVNRVIEHYKDPTTVVNEYPPTQ